MGSVPRPALRLVPGAEHVVEVDQPATAQSDPALPEVHPGLHVRDHHAVPGDGIEEVVGGVASRPGHECCSLPGPGEATYVGEIPDARVVLVAGERYHGHVVTRLDEAADLEVLAALTALAVDVRRLVAVPETDVTAPTYRGR